MNPCPPYRPSSKAYLCPKTTPGPKGDPGPPGGNVPILLVESRPVDGETEGVFGTIQIMQTSDPEVPIRIWRQTAQSGPTIWTEIATLDLVELLIEGARDELRNEIALRAPSFDKPPLLLGVWGQSNSIGVAGSNGNISPETDPINPRVWVLSRGPEEVRRNSPIAQFATSIGSDSGATITRYLATPDKTLMVAQQPLPFPRIPNEASVSFVVPLAQMIQEETDRDVIIVPSAIGSSGFSNSAWGPTEPAFEDLVSLCKFCISEFGAEPFAVVGQQGEADESNGSYTHELRNFVWALRSAVPGFGDIPIVLGECRAGRTNANNAINQVVTWLAKTAIVDNSTLEADPANIYDSLHWSIRAHREVLPALYLTAIDTARTNTGSVYPPIPTPPSPEEIDPVFALFGDDVLVHLPLTEDINDHSGNEVTVTPVSGSPSFSTGYAKFQRSSNHALDLPELPDLAGDYTKAFWVEIPSIGASQHLLSTSQSSPSAYIYATAERNLESDRGIPSSTPRVSLYINGWSHAAVTYEASTGTFRSYINGALIRAETGIAELDDPTERIIRIGNNPALSAGFNGRMASVAIIKRALSYDEILKLIQATRPSS